MVYSPCTPNLAMLLVLLLTVVALAATAQRTLVRPIGSWRLVLPTTWQVTGRSSPTWCLWATRLSKQETARGWWCVAEGPWTLTVVLPDVWYVPGLTVNLVSVGQLTEDPDLSISMGGGMCRIRRTSDGSVLGRAPLRSDTKYYVVDFLKVRRN